MTRTSFRTMMPLAALMAVLIFAGATVASAAKPNVLVDRAGVAIEGYDAVAYFSEGAAVRGQAQHSHTWNGAIWHFSTAANRDTFAADAEAYAPQYGGYCAYAVSKGSTATIDPEAFTIHDDKLYLNYSKRVQKKWLADIPGFIAKADANWPGVLK